MLRRRRHAGRGRRRPPAAISRRSQLPARRPGRLAAARQPVHRQPVGPRPRDAQRRRPARRRSARVPSSLRGLNARAMTKAETMLVATRKGLLLWERDGPIWKLVRESFVGARATYATIDPRTGALWC